MSIEVFTAETVGEGLRVGIVQARFNESVCSALRESCLAELARLRVDAEDVFVCTVPGALEIPAALQGLARTGEFDALIARYTGEHGMLFTVAGLEQATRLEVAAHHARRYRAVGATTVADLTCGIGADAMAFAGVGLHVVAIDADEVTAAVATVNLRHFPEALVRHGDEYLLFADFRSYLDAQKAVEAAWLDPEKWTRMAILNVARMGKFSSDRAVGEYASQIWDAKKVPVSLSK